MKLVVTDIWCLLSEGSTPTSASAARKLPLPPGTGTEKLLGDDAPEAVVDGAPSLLANEVSCTSDSRFNLLALLAGVSLLYEIPTAADEGPTKFLVFLLFTIHIPSSTSESGESGFSGT